ncbi:MAG: enoyl-CoA hydratase/isomerase family protein [Nocardioidaceae bacterium]
MSDQLIVEPDGPLLRVTFNRPEQRNAMTWEMYDGLFEACERADNDDRIRVLVLRGAGDAAFVAGTDIGQFREFSSGDDGVEYEKNIARITGRLETVRVPTLAAISGHCIGGGLALAAVCDLRVATPAAMFGVPIARTLGNCLSMNTHAMLVQHLGPGRTLDLLLRARTLGAEEAHAAGFVCELCEYDDLDARVQSIADALATNAPLTMWAAKESVRRLRLANLPEGDDIVRTVFGSEDFRRGVESFTTKQKPQWTGR